MAYSFHAEDDPSRDSCEAISGLSPMNPFYTPAFVAARQAAGARPWILSLSISGNLVTGCTAFMTSGRLRNKLEIQSLPKLPDGDLFWQGLRQFCRDQKVTELVVNTFGSDEAEIPPLATELWRRSRQEYVLDLTNHALFANLSSNHKRNLRRAERARLAVRLAQGLEDCRIHASLISASMGRRKRKGMKVSDKVDPETFRCFIDNGAGVFYQAVHGDTVLSSVLVLMGIQGGYYHSAGTAPEGMALGSSHFLVHGVAESLRHRGVLRFNLGGVRPQEEGLIRFKSGFGALTVDLEAAAFMLGNPLLKVTRLVQEFVGRGK